MAWGVKWLIRKGILVSVLRLLSVNAWDLYGSTAPEKQDRYRGLEARIAAERTDIVAIQEVISDGTDRASKEAGAVAGLHRLAEATGMSCEISGDPLVGVGGSMHHVGLLFRNRPEIRPVPRTVHRLERETAGMWHAAVSAVFELSGHPVRVMSLQLSPFDPAWRAADCLQILRVVNRGDMPAAIGGDFNSVSLNDPNPYAGRSAQPWHPDHVYQLGVDGTVDRTPAIRLERQGRLRDCAEIVGAQFEPTTGHADTIDHHGPRRIDRWLVTHDFPASAITGYRVLPLETLQHGEGWLTDHRPIEIALELPTR